MSDTESQFELSADVIAAAQKLQEKMQRQALESMVTGMVEAMGGPEAAAEFSAEYDKALVALLAPELAQEHTEVNRAVVENAKAGRSLAELPDLLARFIALNANPEYTAANEKLLKELFETEDDDAEKDINPVRPDDDAATKQATSQLPLPNSGVA